MFNKFRSHLPALGTAAALGLSATAPAFAAAPDVTATVADITAALTPIGLIGVAVLGVLVAVKIYKWVRKAM